MAHRTLSRLMLTAFGVSLLAGAGQLGLAFGFGIVRLTGTFTGAAVNQWPAQLVWVGWFATNAAVAAALLVERLARADGHLTGLRRQLAVAGSAALGAVVVAPLCMQLARSAETGSVHPIWTVAVCAVLGALIGAGAVLAVLAQPPFAWNAVALAGVLWLVALLSVVPSLGDSGPLTPVRLGVLEPAWLTDDTTQRLALLLLPMLTLLAGAATGALARRHGCAPLVSGASGSAGPLLVAFAYLAAGPGHAGDRYQLWPYYAALIAVAAGALGSAATALLPWPSARTEATGAIEPTAILPPLPPTPAPPRPATRRTASTPTVVDPAEPSPAEPAAQPQIEPAGRPTAEPAGQSAGEAPGQPAAEPSPVGDGSDIPVVARGTSDRDASAAGGTAGRSPAEPTPRPRRQLPTPDLTSTTTPPDPSGSPAAPGPSGSPAAPGRGGTTAPDLSAAFADAEPRVSTDPAAVVRDVSAAFTRPPAPRTEQVRPDGDDPRDKGGRRGLFRRGRSRSQATGTEGEEPLPAQDEEYVDWVAGLSGADDDATSKKRRSLRSNGRHHRS
ncbi:hypothetical protein D3H59_13560 [Micromonospora endophytica]|uniref:hypothetical protein n=1 Tax=Micromonospora endophytica TaxID=515350 RepID=UPI000E68B5B4|nr:hypothetical protein [Micromonospora endophytica]RIW46040.1 hypothetical protein D3H59_13560 [Micromonospora endophytica]